MFTNINSVIIVMIEQENFHCNKNQPRLGSSSQGRIQPGAQGHPPPGSDFKHGYIDIIF